MLSLKNKAFMDDSLLFKRIEENHRYEVFEIVLI